MEPSTPAARAQLRLMMRFRDQPPTVWSQVVANRKRYAVLLVVSAAAAAMLYQLAGPTAAAFAGVAVLRDFGLFLEAARCWPVTRSVIDWRRAEQFLAEDGTPPVGDRRGIE